MRITIGAVPLCEGERSSQFPDRFAIDGKRLVQIREFLRADYAKPKGRGNRTHRIAFAVTREHANHRAAVEWSVAHEASIPESGQIQIIAEYRGRTTYYLWYGEVESCVLDPIIGCSTVHTYTLIGGKLSAAPPP